MSDYRAGARRLLILALGLVPLAAPLPSPAQGLPPYAPINPVARERTGLTTQPYLRPDRRWQVWFTTDYGSLIEYTQTSSALYILDAEVLRTQLMVARSVGKRGFLLAEGSFLGAYNGFLDGFLEWYHNLTGFRVAGRDLRPKNQFDYEIHFQGNDFQYARTSGFLDDLRLGAGLRHSNYWSSMASVTIPTGSGPAGYRKGVGSVNATTALHRDFLKRLTYEATLGVGYTARHGELSQWQRTTFLLVAQGLRIRLFGQFSGYGNIIYHSPYYHDTGISELDRSELTGDFGALFRFRRGPEWLLGLTEDLKPSGPAIDVAFRLGARW